MPLTLAAQLTRVPESVNADRLFISAPLPLRVERVPQLLTDTTRSRTNHGTYAVLLEIFEKNLLVTPLVHVQRTSVSEPL